MAKQRFCFKRESDDVICTIDLSTNYGNLFIGSEKYENADYFGTTKTGCSGAIDSHYKVNGNTVYAIPDRDINVYYNTRRKIY